MSILLRRLGLTSLAILTLPVMFAACGDDDSNAAGPGPDLDGGLDAGPLEPFKASVRRTSMGIPHVKADDLGGLGYGYGYVFAEDNLCILEEEILTVRGERAKYFGDVPYDLGNTGSRSNVNSDAVYRMLATKEVIEKSRANLDTEMQAMIRGYAAGVSRYVRELKAGQHEGRHATCRNEAWVREINDEDMYLRFYKLSLLGSSANFIDGIAAAKPVQAHMAPPPVDLEKAKREIGKGLAEIAPKFMAYRNGEVGSNMYAFGSEVTGGGGIQFGNPHFPWFGGERLYQVHLTVPGKIDVQGASLYGVPVVLIGFTENFAWSHTVSTAYRFTPYGLKLKAGDPLTYIQDDVEKPITPVDLSIEVSGEPTPRAVRLYKSEYGPMIYLGNAFFDWTLDQAFTIRDANAENFRLIKHYARWNMAKSLDEFARIHAEEVAVPWVNTTAADKAGNAYYADITVVPNVTDEHAKRCEVSELSMLLERNAPGLPLLDGSKKACDWKVDPASPQPGIFPASELPKVERKDWVVNCNDSYWLTNTKAPLKGFAKIVGREEYQQSLRSRLCHQQVLDRVAGTDGLPGTNVTADLVKQIVLGSRVFSAEKFKTEVLTSVCAQPTISLTSDPLTGQDVTPAETISTGPGCAALRAWDNRNNPDSKGSLVWDELWFRLEALYTLAKLTYTVPFDPADPVNTPRTMDLTAPEVQQAFAAAIRAVTKAGFALDAPRSAFSWRAGKGGLGDRIPVPGGFQRTGNFAIAQVDGLPTLQPGTGYGPMLYGNSYMQVVAFTPSG
ncbi:MAG: penicillin acylase family protein, partial [Labilithrix sp.]|nr:penicillin acylase family protein [Labilithrix sp.]